MKSSNKARGYRFYGFAIKTKSVVGRLTQQCTKSISRAADPVSWQRDVSRTSRGYTIIEAMLFLIITATLLVSALAIFQGRHERTGFTQAIRETEARIVTMINEVGSGQFPSDGSYTCTEEGGDLHINSANGTAAQGTQDSCVYLGKILQIDNGGRNYRVYTLVGSREAERLGDGPTEVIADDDEDGPDITQEHTLPGGIEFKNINYGDDNQTSQAVGFITSFVSQGGDDDVVSGSQSVEMLRINADADKEDLIERARTISDDNRNPAQALICIQESGGGRQAAILLGGSGRQLTTDTIIDADEECGDD